MSLQRLDPETVHREVNSIYVTDSDRYVVSLIVGYTDDDIGNILPEYPLPKRAARWAIDLTRDDGAHGTIWFVYDRETGEMHQFEQHEFDPEMEGMSV